MKTTSHSVAPVRRLTPSHLLRQAMVLALLGGASLASAGVVTKANNADALNLTTAWVGGVAPGAADVARWDNTLSDVGWVTNTLGASLSWSGLQVLNPVGAITIVTNAGGNTLTLGTGGIDLANATQDLTLSNNVALLSPGVQTWAVGSGRLLTMAGALSRPLAAGTGGQILKFNTMAGGTVNVSSGTASLILGAYTLLNGTDFAGLDGSLNVVPGASAVAYTANPDANLPNQGTLTVAAGNVYDVFQGSAAGNYGVRLTGNLTCYGAMRFNAPHAYRTDWTVDCNTRALYFGGAAGILVTTNVGTDSVIFNSGSGHSARLYGGTDWVIQQENIYGDLIFNGNITQGGTTPFAPMLTKSGAGRLIINSSPAHTGPTRVLEGTLMMNGYTTAGSAVSVANGATLAGAGGIQGGTTVAAGGAINPGDANGVGVLTMSALTLNAGSYLKFYSPTVPTTNTVAPLNLTNNLTVGGTVNVAILSGGAAVGQYPLVKWTNAVPGASFANFTLAVVPPHVVANLSNNAAASTIDLVITAVNEPLTWQAGNAVWDLNTTANWTNIAGPTTYQQVGVVGDSVVFDDTATGASPISVTLNTSVTPATVTVNNATKAYTLTGSGAIGGTGRLTKSGAAGLTLATVNTFSGGVYLNGGTVNFTTLNNLGVGAVTFGGGTLQFAAGNVEDLSARTVTLAAGGGTLDVGANTITFANPIGNSGAGGLVKAGSGTLTLTGTNRYAGATIISNGVLALAYGATITNSVSIQVNSGATLDLNTAGNPPLSLGTISGQTLLGNGTVAGSITLPTGTTMAPGAVGTVGTLTLNTGDLTISGGTLACDVTAATRDLIVLNGGLTINSGTLQLNVTGTLANGRYKLIQYTPGSFYSGAGSSAKLTVLGFAQAGKAATLSDTVDGEIDLVIADTSTDVIKWAGVGTDWDQIGSLNWLKGATAWAFTNGNYVTFDDAGAANPSVSLRVPLAPTLITVTSDTTSYSFDDGGGKITGAASLVKNGAATLTINTVNDNTGTTVVNGGTLQVYGGLGSGYITNKGIINFAQITAHTVTGISGTGNVELQGSGVLTWLGANTDFSGGVTIDFGATLQLGNGGAVGFAGTRGTITNNGTLTYNKSGAYAATNAIEGTGNLTVTGSGVSTLTASNGYTGVTTISTAKLIMGSANAHAGNGPLYVQAGGTNDMNGFDLQVARLNSTLSAGGRIVNNAGTGTNVLTINYDGTGAADSSIVIADNDGTGGRIALVKNGTGTQTIRSDSTYSGGTIINAGALTARGFNNAFGSGTNIILNGGQINNYAATLGYTIQTTADSGLETSGNCFYNGPLIGTNNLNVTIEGSGTGGTVMSWGGASQMTNFSGRFIINGLNANGCTWRWTSTVNGSAAAIFYLSNNVGMACNGSAYTISLGSLEGETNTSVWGYPTTYLVGGKNTNGTYSGTVGGSGTFVKTGTGTLTLNGAYPFYGATVVSNGTLVMAALANPTNSSSLTVRAGALLDVGGMGVQINETNEVGEVTNSYVQVTSTLALAGNTTNQTLTGGGTLRGSVVASANSTINPGDGIGTLTVATNVTLGGLLLMELNRTNAAATNDMLVAASLTGGGTLTITNLGTPLVTGDKFKLFNHPVSGFTTVNLPQNFVQSGGASSTYVWGNNLAVDGTIQVTAGYNPVDPTPTNITFSVTGNTLSLSWPEGHRGWTLQQQTNSLTAGLGTNWVDVPGSTSIISTNITVDATKPAVFYRLKL